MHRDPVTSARWTEWFTPVRFALLLGLLITVNFAPILCGFRTFFLRDFGYFAYPLAQYQRECFWRGELPLWNPYNACGIPFLAQWNTLTLYPPSLIYLLLPLPWSLNLFCLLHLFAGGLGTYFLARSWSGNHFAAAVAGMLFVFSGFTLNCAMWPGIIAAVGLMPWVVWLVQRGWREGGRVLLLGALLGGMQMLTGAPEVILLTWCTLAGLLLVDLSQRDSARGRAIVRAGGTVVFVASLAAAQLLPFFELVRASDRSQDLPTASWSMPAWGWANFFVPLFHSYRAPIGSYFQPGQDWIASYYTGVCGIAFAIVAMVTARRRTMWLLAALTVLAIALALGEHGFIYPALKKAFPQLGFMRYPVKFLILVNFALPLLAAFGVAGLLSVQTRFRLSMWLGVAVVIALLIVGIVWFAHAHPARSEDPVMTQSNALLRLGVLAAMAGLVVLLCRASRERTLRVASLATLLILAIDGITHSPKATPSLPTGVMQSGLVSLTPAPGLQGHRAMLIRPAHDEIYATMVSDPLKDFVLHRQALFGNCNLMDGIPTSDGFYPLYVKEQREVWSQLWFRHTNYTVSPLLDFLSVTHINADTIFDWTNRVSALPVATIGQAPVFTDASTTLGELISPSFDPARAVFLPPSAKDVVRATAAVPAKILSATFAAHRINLQVESPADTLLVLAQSYYAPWRVLTDGQPLPLLRANHGFQAVAVPPGNHRVVFEYRDMAFRLGAIITGTALGAMTLLWFLRPKWL